MTSPGEQSTPGATPSLERIERVFFEVAGLAPADRDQAIARLCAGDASLEREVRLLVGSAAALGSFLEQPALGREFDQIASESGREAPDELVGQTVGNFRIERRIASGGMGTVYQASRSDGQFAQKVAVKVVKRGMDSEEILRRFRVERQTLASLDHPNIARLIDGGMTVDGRPFVVMEYVDGKPIDRYCDEKGVGLRDRLALFRQVCEGVHHAHQNLVIHRDIKPSNILVTPQGVPKLLDFGISKVIAGGTGEAPSATLETDRRLTPEYASPEQVEGGPLTTASDVYSLGVVLYELLTGARPYHFGLRTSEEVRRVVCSLVPLPPSQAVTVRVSRLRTRSKRFLAEGAGNAEGTKQERTGPGDSTPLGPLPPSMMSSGTDAEPAIDVPKTRGVSSTRLRGLLRGDLDIICLMALRKEPHRRYASAEQFSADIGRYLSGMPVQARKDTVAYRASKFMRRHAVSVSLAACAVAVLSAATVMLYHQGVQLRQQKSDLVAANQRLDENLTRLSESRRFLQAVISGAEAGNQGPDAKLGDVLKNAATTLRTAPPADPLTLAAAEGEAGQALMSLGMINDAKPLLEDAAKSYSTLPADSDARMDASQSLGELAFYEGRYADAEQAFKDLLALEHAKNAGAHTVRESAILNNLGSSVRLQNRSEESITIQREALAATIAAVGETSLEAAETRNNLASSLLQKGAFAEAVEQYTRAFEVRKALLRPDHPLLVRCESNLGLAKLRAGNVGEAIPLLTHAADNWERAFGPEHAGRIAAITSLSQALRKEKKQEEALDWLREALAWQEQHQPSAAVPIAATEANIGITLAEQGEDAQALPMLERVLPTLTAGKNVNAIVREATESLASLYEKRGEAAKAQHLRDSLK